MQVNAARFRLPGWVRQWGRVMRILLALGLIAGPVWAEDWVPLTGPQIGAALGGHVVTYEGGATQSFTADGATQYTDGQPSSGHWRVEGDRYCSVWPPSDRWTCYGVEQAGAALRFVATDGSASLGTLTD